MNHKHTLVIYAPAARHGGGLSVLIEFIIAAKKRTENSYIIIVREDILNKLPHFKHIEYIAIKSKSYFMRVYLDFYGASKLIHQKHPRNVNILCLSNSAIVSNKKDKQWVMAHNSYAISRLIPEHIDKNKRIIFYTTLYPLYLNLTFRKRHTFIVQRESLALKLAKSYSAAQKNNILTVTPTTADLTNILQETDKEFVSDYFFCPLSEAPHKNIKLIHKIASSYNDKKILFVITVSKEYYVENIARNIPENVYLSGNINLEKMAVFYANSKAVIFPSLLETAGLPLLETTQFKKYILVSDLDYAHDLIGSYEGAIFLNPINSDEWVKNLVETDYNITLKEFSNPARTFPDVVLDKIESSDE